MKRLVVCIYAALLMATPLMADDWNFITGKGSGDYYYGEGQGSTEEMAEKNALAALAGMIATNVTSGFNLIISQKNEKGRVESKSDMENVIKTYSHSMLTNVKKEIPVKKKNNFVVRCWMLRSELDKIYEVRTDIIKQWVRTAERALDEKDIKQALRYYYWAYTLLRSLQHPAKVKDRDGNLLSTELPVRIENILKNIKVVYEGRDEDRVNLLFTYKGEPVSFLDITYNDGHELCTCEAKDGRGTLCMVGGNEDSYHIVIDYEQKDQARGDDEVEPVLDIIPKRDFKQAHINVKAKADKNVEIIAASTGIHLTPTASQIVADDKAQQHADVVAKVVDAISEKRYQSVTECFTPEGLRRYNRLISYGQGRVEGTQRIQYFKGVDGHMVARGMQMSFLFKTGKKKSYVEDVVFSIDSLGRIDNVAFGLGNVAENDILCKNAEWSDDTKELLMEFLENYKTAYCLKDIDYLETVFDDRAVIIVGNVAKIDSKLPTAAERGISLKGQEVINYNRITKDQYLKNLRRCFAKNEFINIHFTNNDIQFLDKFKNQEKYGIQIGQEYNSSTYADKGFLFLQVNMTNHQEPKIEVRTWQPNEVDQKKIYNAGWFYDE